MKQLVNCDKSWKWWKIALLQNVIQIYESILARKSRANLGDRQTERQSDTQNDKVTDR